MTGHPRKFVFCLMPRSAAEFSGLQRPQLRGQSRATVVSVAVAPTLPKIPTPPPSPSREEHNPPRVQDRHLGSRSMQGGGAQFRAIPIYSVNFGPPEIDTARAAALAATAGGATAASAHRGGATTTTTTTTTATAARTR